LKELKFLISFSLISRQIGHDGVVLGSGWFLKEVEVDMPTKGKHYHFTCHQWLARDKSDGKTTRLLSVDDGTSTVTSYRPCKYRIFLPIGRYFLHHRQPTPLRLLNRCTFHMY
jgi:hypothetical protein